MPRANKKGLGRGCFGSLTKGQRNRASLLYSKVYRSVTKYIEHRVKEGKIKTADEAAQHFTRLLKRRLKVERAKGRVKKTSTTRRT